MAWWHNILDVKESRHRYSRVILCVLLVLAVGVRWLLLYWRWINPDEGAHLLDARFLLQGMIPVVDYASRQPLYVLLLAVFIKVFGISLNAGRLLPLVATIGSGWMIFLIGRRLFDARVGLLAAAIYLFLPYTIIWSTVVKTEMPAIFFCCVSVYFLIKALQLTNGVGGYLLLSGSMAALAFYVRQPTIYIPTASVLLLLLDSQTNGRERWRRIGFFLSGYALIVFVVGAFFANYCEGKQWLFSQLNPIHLVFSRVGHFLGILPAEMRVVDTEGYRILHQDMAYTLQSWRDAILFSAFILLAVLSAGRTPHSASQTISTNHLTGWLLLWPLVALLAYIFQSIQSVFYSQYLLEVLPYLTVLAAAQIIKLGERFSFSWWPIAVAVATMLFAVIFFVMRIFWHWLWPLAGHLSLAMMLTMPIIFLLSRGNPKTSIPTFRFLAAIATTIALSWLGHLLGWEPLLYAAIGLGAFVLIMTAGRGQWTITTNALVVMGFFLTASYSGARLGPKYEGIWAPATLQRVAQILSSQSDPTDTVLSGGMIWTFSSGLQPYAGVTHPTVFVKKQDRTFYDTFQQHRPTFIILDEYTEKKFARYWPFIADQLRTNYYLVATVGGSRQPVQIYRCGEPPAIDLPDLATATVIVKGGLP